MHSIDLFTFLKVKLLKKSYGASNKFHFPKFLKLFFYRMYFKSLQNVLDPYLNLALKSINKNCIGQSNSRIIWIFWWQGYNCMPSIVQHCVGSVKSHANGYKVILITKKNIYKYAHIPNYIYNKVKKGCITLTHFSDILRFNLLNNYGGLWCDATIYCTSQIDYKYFNYLYTSGGYIGVPPRFANGRWTGFLIGGYRCNALFQFMSKFFELYWKYNKYQVSYFLIDLGLHYAYVNNIGNFKHYDDTIACYNNPNLFMFIEELNEPFNLAKFNKFTANTNMFKLTYKINFLRDKGTLYSYLISNK